MHKKSLAPKDIHTDMIETLGNDVYSYAIVHYILRKKLSARWVPRLLTFDQKDTRRTLPFATEGDNANILQRFVTMGETCVHHFTPGAKQQSNS